MNFWELTLGGQYKSDSCGQYHQFLHVPPDTIIVPLDVPVERIKYIKPDNWGLLIEKIPYIALVLLALVFSGLFFSKK